MSHWYRETIVASGRAGVFWVLVAFVITFVTTRLITRRIRARPQGDPEEEGGRYAVGDLHVGGVHVHHQVWGILLILVSALLEFANQPGSPWLEILGAMFGVGAALTLDEFALWVHLDDVYWSREGRRSIDAVLVGACVCGILLLGTTPLGVDTSEGAQAGLGAVAVTVVVNLGFSVVAFLKGKLVMGTLGLFLPLVGLVGAVRLAQPGSPWARWRYGARPAVRARAEARYARQERRYDRVRDLLGGAPNESPGETPPT